MVQNRDTFNPNILNVDGNTLTITLGDYVLSLKIQSRQEVSAKRLKLPQGKTLYDLVLEAAREFTKDIGEQDFGAADLYHVARRLHPEIDLRQNSWSAHVVASAPEHPSSKYHLSKRNYLRYHGRGRYSLKPEWKEQDDER